MRAIMFSDCHLESGTHLGTQDLDYESSRLRDAERVLGEIVADPHDVLIFGGDMGRTATPRPVAYRVLQRALRASSAPTLLVMGNHDWSGSRGHTNLHVVADGLPNAAVYTAPTLVQAGELQVGVVPWTPPTRLFDAARHNPKEMNRVVSEKLVGVTHALARKLDPERPSLLVLHWLLAEGAMASGTSVLEAQEPLIAVADIEHGGWDVILAGHNHRMQRLGTRCWHVGPPLRTGFGEADVPTGYMRVTWGDGDPRVEHVPTEDRALVLVELDPEQVIARGEDWALGRSVDGAIVRVRCKCSEEQARALNADGQRLLRGIVEKLKAGGSFKVVGPALDVERVRRVRSDLTVDVSPERALDAWLTQQEVNEPLRASVLAEAKEIMDA